MTKPAPETIEPARVTELARQAIAADRFPYLATIHGATLAVGAGGSVKFFDVPKAMNK